MAQIKTLTRLSNLTRGLASYWKHFVTWFDSRPPAIGYQARQLVAVVTALWQIDLR